MVHPRLRQRLTAVVWLCCAGPLMAAPQPPIPGPTLSVHTDLVVLPVMVTDKHGVPVPGLSRENFVVYDNGVRQRIQFFRAEDAPATVGLVIDNSGSMQDKRGDVIAAARAFAEASNPLDQLFLVYFNERVTMGLPPDRPFTSSIPELSAALATIGSRGLTALYDAIATALDHLRQGDRPRKALVVISDGGDDASRTSKQEVLRMAARSQAAIYTIGLFTERDPDRNPGVLRQLASSTGGQAFFPETDEIVAVCRHIAATIRAGYTIGYVATGVQSPKGHHTVRVELSGPGTSGLRVSTRPGYEESGSRSHAQ
jgi:VWFA-related protein